MKYDNPRIRDIIDGCVEKILEEPDEEFFRYENTPSRWELRLAQELYAELVKSPSNCFASLEPAVRYMVKVTGCDDINYADGGRACIMYLNNSSWVFSYKQNWTENRFTFGVSLEEQGVFEVASEDKSFPVGVILAINYHFPYIKERALGLKRETEKRYLIQQIEAVTEQQLG